MLLAWNVAPVVHVIGSAGVGKAVTETAALAGVFDISDVTQSFKHDR